MTLTELHQLPAIEKIKIIELLWTDLAASEEVLPDLTWHESELAGTEAAFSAGAINTVDWQLAKKNLRAQFE